MTARHLDSAPMASRPQLSLLTATFGAALALAVGGCGSSGPENGLSQEQADGLVGALENLRDDVERGDCADGQVKLGTIREDIAEIGSQGDVDKEILAGLEQLTDQTESLLDECAGEAEEEPEETTTSSSTSTTEPETTSSEETTTEETTTEEEPEEPEDEEDEEPVEEQPPPEEEPPPSEPPGNSEGGFSPGGTAPPGQEKKQRELGEPGSTKPADGKGRMMGGAAPRADEERKSR